MDGRFVLGEDERCRVHLRDDGRAHDNVAGLEEGAVEDVGGDCLATDPNLRNASESSRGVASTGGDDGSRDRGTRAVSGGAQRDQFLFRIKEE